MPTKRMPPFPLKVWEKIFAYAANLVYSEDNAENKGLSRVFPNPYLEQQDLDSATRFPNALVSTSPLFKAILLRMPAMWTRLTIYLDEEDPAATLQGHIARLEKVQLKPTEILVTRKHWKVLAARPSTAPIAPIDPSEEDKMLAIMYILVKHLSEVTSLVIRTTSGNALPSIMYFRHLALPKLHTLVLDSLLRGTGRVLGAHGGGPSTPKDIRLPRVRNLTLTGPNFVALARNPVWKKWYRRCPRSCGRFDHLRVSHFDDVDGQDTSKFPMFTLHDFFTMFFAGCHSATVAELANMHCRRLYIHEPEKLKTVPKRVTLEKVSRDVVQSYLEYVSREDDLGGEEDEDDYYELDPMTSTHEFIDCALGPAKKWTDDVLSLPGDSILLKGMSDPTSVKICLDLGAKNAYSLWVSDCLGFDDSVLQHLVDRIPVPASSTASSSGGKPDLSIRAIYLDNCPRVTLRALRELVDELNGICYMDDEDDEEDADIESATAFEEEMNDFYAGIVLHPKNVSDDGESDWEDEESDVEKEEELEDENENENEDEEEEEEEEEEDPEDDMDDDELDDFEDADEDLKEELEVEGEVEPTLHDDDEDYYDEDESHSQWESDEETEPDISDEDLESEIFGPQIRMIRVTGKGPKITEKDVAWFRCRGVLLETA